MLFKKIRLGTLLVTTFGFQLVLAVGIVGYSSLKSGERAVENISLELGLEITKRIQERLASHLEAPHLVNQFNANAIASNIVSLDRSDELKNLLLQQVMAHNTVNNSYIGTVNGNFIGVERSIENGSLNYLEAGKYTDENLWIIAVDNDEGSESQIEVLSKFDPRERPWYTAAIEKGGSVWSRIYRDFTTGELTITASQPINDPQGKLIGVLGSDFLFSSNIEYFLRDLKTETLGEVIIVDRKGEVLATSSNEREQNRSLDDIQNVLEEEESINNKYISFDFSQNIINRLLSINGGNLSDIDNTNSYELNLNEGDYLLQVTPLNDDRGINWLILVVLPKDDFLAEIDNSKRITFTTISLALIISMLISVAIANRVNRPLLNIIKATKEIIGGNLNHRVTGSRIVELKKLALSFNRMAKQQEDSFTKILEKEERFRSLIDNIPGAIYRCGNDSLWTMEFLSDSIKDIVGYPSKDFIGSKNRSFVSIIYSEDRRRVEEVLRKAVDTHSPYQVEYRLLHRDGSIRWVHERGKGNYDVTGNIAHLDGAIFDITDQKQTQETLAVQGRTIEAIVNAIPDLLIRTTIDGMELDVLGNTDLSLENPDLDNKHKMVRDYLPINLAAQRIESVRTAIKTNKLQTYEQEIIGVYEKPRHEEVRIAPINESEALVIVRDTTEKKRIDEAFQELNAATSIQANMMPDYSQLCENVEQIDISAIMIPAKNVGGDFYDVFSLDHRYLCVTIGDVSGKGIPAALFMVRAMTLLRMAVDTAMPLNTSVSKVNHFLCQNNYDCMFVTLFIGLIDVYTGEMRYVNCGHNPPYLSKSGDEFVALKPPKGILLGVYEGAEYQEGTMSLNKNDILILYTDGVTEAENSESKFFSEYGAINSLNAVKDRSQTEVLVDKLVKDVNQFSTGVPQSDDITIVALRYLGNENMDQNQFEEIEIDWLVQNLGIDSPHKF